MNLTVPYFKQETEYTCTLAVIRMMFSFYLNDPILSEKDLTLWCSTTRNGTSEAALTKFLTAWGIQRLKLDPTNIIFTGNLGLEIEIKINTLKDVPVQITYTDDIDELHDAIIVGFGNGCFILNDSYYGENYSMPYGIFNQVIKDAYVWRLT